MRGILSEKLEATRRMLAGCGRVLVAYSGGVDSTFLAKLARDTLGKAQAPAVTADSPSLSREDLAEAVRLARALDLEHLVIRTGEVDDPAYRRNTLARCYCCKATLFAELEALAAARGIPALVYGVLADDAVAERPGHRAALQFGVRSPLQEAGLEKWDVRELARELGLPNWDRPQNSCLASRIPHGQDVTKAKLRQVELAEAFLRGHGFRQVRVRHLGAHARIEVPLEELARFQDPALDRAIAEHLERLGFETIGVDRGGYQAGGAERVDVDEVLLDRTGRENSELLPEICRSERQEGHLGFPPGERP